MALFQAAVPPSWFAAKRKEAGLAPEKGVYTSAVTSYLMVGQWLNADHTLEPAVEEVVGGRVNELLLPHKRLADGTLSTNPAAYNKARHRLSRKLIEELADQMFGHLLAQVPDVLPVLGRRVFVLDGSTLNLVHTKKMLEAYPPASNQYGPCHWPQMRIVVAHELISGLAARPAWGSIRVSEQELAVEVMNRLPDDAVDLLDRNFGVFYYVYHAVQGRKHDVVVRLTAQRARSLLHGSLPPNKDQSIEWRPSAWERRMHPELPADAVVRGRWLSCQVQNRGRVIQLFLFTTLDLPLIEIVKLYGHRWNIETDLRSLKQTLDLDALTGKDPEIIEKELLAAITAYNMVRATIYAAAQVAGVEPRQLSFSHVRKVVYAHLPELLHATSEEAYHSRLDMILRRAATCKLPNRRNRPSYPRAVWSRGSTFPKRKS